MSVNFDNPQFIRVAWFDRKEQKFDKGSWQAIGEKSLNDLNLKKRMDRYAKYKISVR